MIRSQLAFSWNWHCDVRNDSVLVQVHCTAVFLDLCNVPSVRITLCLEREKQRNKEGGSSLFFTSLVRWLWHKFSNLKQMTRCSCIFFSYCFMIRHGWMESRILQIILNVAKQTRLEGSSSSTWCQLLWMLVGVVGHVSWHQSGPPVFLVMDRMMCDICS